MWVLPGPPKGAGGHGCRELFARRVGLRFALLGLNRGTGMNKPAWTIIAKIVSTDRPWIREEASVKPFRADLMVHGLKRCVSY